MRGENAMLRIFDFTSDNETICYCVESNGNQVVIAPSQALKMIDSGMRGMSNAPRSFTNEERDRLRRVAWQVAGVSAIGVSFLAGYLLATYENNSRK
jgi:hypothetical protein